MKIHALNTGTVRVKHSFLFPRSGARRQLDLFLPGTWSEPLPIHCWAIEHEGVLCLIDTGETAAARNVPFARFDVAHDQELRGAMDAAGLELDDVSEVVLTHARLDGGPFGAFARSRALSDDGRIVAVETPGHTPGHISVICVEDSGSHVMLAGDATDTLEQLQSLRADAIGPDPKVHVATLETILAHCAQHPTVYLPSHDPESAARLAGSIRSAEELPAP
ncbi:MAG TPA: hypothetical protein VK721_06055 [Solirubrobacteraceae bacterium]|jgi:N-acyl homoserine lactone hydrolase|nr:hypothetical protein [Solirubrobacteraceae bacterium]